MKQILLFLFCCISLTNLKSQCAAGFYFDGVTCQPCPPGSYCPDGTNKINCPTGKFAASTGQAVCDDCPTGKFAASTGQAICNDCPTGKFAASTGQAFCNDCPTGKFAASTGQAVCDDCPTGKFAAITGQAICNDCPTGKFAASTGQAICNDCPTGKFAASTGQAICNDCPTGKFAASTGQATCDDCLPGTYAQNIGQIACDNCMPGTYARNSGQSSCDNCIVGAYQPAQASINCIACPVGTYAQNQGQALCDNCPSGFTTSTTGSTSPADCNVVLGITLFEFSAAVDKNIVRLKWTTTEEKNTSFYVLQKSTNLEGWTTIARINGKGTTQNTTYYTATDPFPIKGVTYYRLKEVEFDGVTHYSKIISAESFSKASLKVYPNPATAELNVAHSEESIKTVFIYNLVGQKVAQYNFEKTNIGTLDLSDLISGQYILSVYTEGGAYAERIVVSHR